MDNSVNVKKHPRTVPKGRTTVKRHTRSKVISNQIKKTNGNENKSRLRHNFTNRDIVFPKQQFPSLQSVEKEFFNAGYQKAISNLETSAHESDSEFVKEIPNDKREHHRIYEDLKGFWVESHIDQNSPLKKPLSHFTQDVIQPMFDESTKNFNDTQWIFLKK